jgi:hypothetical protein
MKSLSKNLATPGSRKPNESQLVSAILRALHLKGIWAWRVNSSLTVLPKQGATSRRVVKGAPAGSPDILLVLPFRNCRISNLEASSNVTLVTVDERTLGALCGLEVKTTTGKQSESQREWQRRAETYGVRYAVVRSIGEALATVETWRSGTPAVVGEVGAGGKVERK